MSLYLECILEYFHDQNDQNNFPQTRFEIVERFDAEYSPGRLGRSGFLEIRQEEFIQSKPEDEHECAQEVAIDQRNLPQDALTQDPLSLILSQRRVGIMDHVLQNPERLN